MKQLNVSLLVFFLSLIATVQCWGHRDDPGLPMDPKIQKAMRKDQLHAKLKTKGQLPMEEWFEDRDFANYYEQISDFWPFLRKEKKYWNRMMPNITRMSGPFYDYYVVDPYFGEFTGKGTTWVMLIGPIWYNETRYYGYQMQEALMKLEDKGKAKGYKMYYVESRYDELLTETFDNRQNPSMWVIDGEDGIAYHWDKSYFPSNETIFEYLDKKQYRNSTFSVRAPRQIDNSFLRYVYVIKWLRRNIGQRFEDWVNSVPGAPRLFQSVVNFENDDPLRFKRDRLTAYATPFLLIFVLIPMTWKFLKLLWRIMLDCCWKEVEIEVEQDDPKLLAQKELAKKQN